MHEPQPITYYIIGETELPKGFGNFLAAIEGNNELFCILPRFNDKGKFLGSKDCDFLELSAKERLAVI